MTTGRVKVAKEVRKLRDRQDSLDDITSSSDDEVVPVKKSKKNANKPTEAQVQAEKERQSKIDAEVAELKAKI